MGDDAILLIREAIESFIRDIDSHETAVPLALHAIEKANQLATEQSERLLQSPPAREGSGGEDFLVVDPQDLQEYSESTGRAAGTGLAYTKILRALIVSLVSQFDSLVGRLIRGLFVMRPEKFAQSDRQITLAELIGFQSIEDAKEYFIEKEIEKVLRKSHVSQFEWLEKKFDMPLTKGLKVWPYFIELTERRNLFVHTDGKVSSQYIKVCKDHKVNLEEGVKVGTEMPVDLPYFEMACRVIFEMGIKLAQVLWRKHDPRTLAQADQDLVIVCDNLIRAERYDQAQTLLAFGTDELPKHSSDESKKTFIVMQAQSYKLAGDNETAAKIMNATDWTGSSDSFKLAKEVLTNNDEGAIALVIKIGRNGTYTKGDYLSLPLFKQIRESERFQRVIDEVFE